jgi:hypothetical protein
MVGSGDGEKRAATSLFNKLEVQPSYVEPKVEVLPSLLSNLPARHGGGRWSWRRELEEMIEKLYNGAHPRRIGLQFKRINFISEQKKGYSFFGNSKDFRCFF